MKKNIIGRKVDLKNSFIERAEKKLDKFDKFFSDEARAELVVTVEKHEQTVELTIHDKGMIFRSEEKGPAMEEALEKVFDVMLRQIRRNKTRLERRMKASYQLSELDETGDIEYDDDEDFDIVKSKRFELRPMDVQEAILQMNMIGHQFFMFSNAETGNVSVVYVRKNGKYGMIEPEI